MMCKKPSPTEIFAFSLGGGVPPGIPPSPFDDRRPCIRSACGR